MEETARRRTEKEEGHKELRGEEETAEEKQTEETWSDGEAGRSRKIINGEEKDAEGEEERERWVQSKSSYFNIKQHREELNVPFTASFACL